MANSVKIPMWVGFSRTTCIYMAIVNPSIRIYPGLNKGYLARGADPSWLFFHVNAYKHLTTEGLPFAIIQPWVM